MSKSLPEHALRDLARDRVGLSAALILSARRDKRPKPTFHVNRPILLERPVGMLDSVRVDLQLGRKRADGWQWFVRLQDSNRNAPSNLVADLPVNRAWVGRV